MTNRPDIHPLRTEFIKDKIFDNVKKSKIYNKVLEILPDAELVEFKINEHKDD